MNNHLAAAAVAAFAVTTPAYAEVSDKIPTYSDLWVWGLALNGLAIGLSSWRWWCGLLVLPISALWAVGVLDMLHDPFVGPAILREQGRSYLHACYVSTLLVLSGPPLIAVLAKRLHHGRLRR